MRGRAPHDDAAKRWTDMPRDRQDALIALREALCEALGFDDENDERVNIASCNPWVEVMRGRFDHRFYSVATVRRYLAWRAWRTADAAGMARAWRESEAWI